MINNKAFMNVPEDTRYVAKLEYHLVTFDPARAAPGLVFGQQNTLVTQNVPDLGFKVAMGRDGWSSGRHFFAFNIIDCGAGNRIMIGVSDGTRSSTYQLGHYPGLMPDGVSYGSDGYKYSLDANSFCGRYWPRNSALFGSAYQSQAEVGVLLDMEFHTVTFYNNGRRVGTAAGSNIILGESVYYPAVSLYALGATLISLPYNDVKILNDGDVL